MRKLRPLFLLTSMVACGGATASSPSKGTNLVLEPDTVSLGSGAAGGVDPVAPAAGGDLDKAGVRRVIRGSLPAITACYEDALTRDDTIAGAVTVVFTIERDGRVSAAVVTGVGDDVMHACQAAVFRTLQFPASQGIANVSYPLELKK